METLAYPVRKILLPYDGSPWARHALHLAARLAGAGGEAVTGITVLHVIGGSYVARHVHNVDLRVTRVEQQQDWQRLRQLYLDREVRPLLAEAEKILQGLGVRVPIELRVAEGKISQEILKTARDGQFSTLILGRRGLSPLKALLLGSVTRGVLTQAHGLTVYVVTREVKEGPCPISPLLLPVDGSLYSLAAVRQAAALAQAFRDFQPSLTLLHVVDVDLLGLEFLEGRSALVQQGERALAGAREILETAGLKGQFEEKLVTGIPSQVIVEEAEKGGYALILMGSKGHSPLAHLLLGSVTSSVVHTVSDAVVGVVYA